MAPGFFKDYDFYRKIPKDLTVSTTHGFVLSITSIFLICLVFFSETHNFLTTDVMSSAIVDTNEEQTMKISFNITLLAISCEFATVTVADVLGTRRFNVSSDIKRINTDKYGNPGETYRFSNRIDRDSKVRDDEEFPGDMLHQLHEDGEHAIELHPSEFDEWLKHHSYTFVDFYAPWCSHCQNMAAAYEALAEKVHAEQLPASIVKINCDEHKEFCMSHRIHGFPTLRLFKDSVAVPPDYNLDRMVETMFRYLKSKVFAVDNEHSRSRHLQRVEQHAKNVGCQLSGYLRVNRVPGYFHVEARSASHDINAVMTNMSLIVNQLSFGPTTARDAFLDVKNVREWMTSAPAEFYSSNSISPLNDVDYSVPELHQAYHHYIKVISTQFGFGPNKNAAIDYQFVATSKRAQYNQDDVPKAVFTYDMSPMSILIEQVPKRWYDYVCSICALVGGSFTVVGFISGILGSCFGSNK